MPPSGAQFWSAIQKMIDAGMNLVRPVRGSVVSATTTVGRVSVLRTGADDADGQAYPVLRGFDYAAADDLISLPYNGSLIPVGKLHNGTRSTLTISDRLITSQGLQVFTKAGALVDGDFTVAPTNGLIGVDTTNNAVMYRSGGTWRNAVSSDFLLNNVPAMGGHLQAARAAYLTNTIPLGALTGVTLTANRCYYVPVWIPDAFSCDAFIQEVTAAVAGDIQMGLYTCSSTFFPDAQLFQCTKTNTTTTGVKTYTLGSTAVVGARWYFIAIASVTAMSIKGSVTTTNFPALRGGALASDGGATVYLMASETLSGGWTTLPANATPTSLANTYLHVGMRVV